MIMYLVDRKRGFPVTPKAFANGGTKDLWETRGLRRAWTCPGTGGSSRARSPDSPPKRLVVFAHMIEPVPNSHSKRAAVER